MRENDLREQIAGFPIKAEWKSAMLVGTHSLLTMPTFVAFSGRNPSHDDMFVEMRWQSFYDSPTECFTAKFYENGFIETYSSLRDERDVIPPSAGTTAYQWRELLRNMEDEVVTVREMLGL